MTVESLAQVPRQMASFAPEHPADRNFFLALLGLTWLGIVSGFGLDVVDHIRNGNHPYLPIVHVHAVIFMGWLALLTTQMLLIRTRHVHLHRRLGMAAIWMIPLMVTVGLATAWFAQRQQAQLGVGDYPQFISINLTDMLGFATLAGAGIALRRDSSAHKRLMLLSTFFLSTAGFARLWLLTIGTVGTDTFWSFLPAYNLGGDVPIAMLGFYDVATRGRLHPAYVLGAAWVLINQLAAAWLFFSPSWKETSIWLLGLS